MYIVAEMVRFSTVHVDTLLFIFILDSSSPSPSKHVSKQVFSVPCTLSIHVYHTRLVSTMEHFLKMVVMIIKHIIDNIM